MQKKPAQKKRPRTERRENLRALRKLGDQRERLAAQERGGTPDFPIDVESASQIETRAASLPCLRCGEEVRVQEHLAHAIDGASVREVRTRCKACSAQRSLWFRIAGSMTN